MCLAIPAKVVSVKGSRAVVDVLGEKRNAKIGLLSKKPRTGDYVVLRGSVAVELLDRKQAVESLKAWRQLG